MYTERVSQAVRRYEERFDELNSPPHDEYYKWRAVETFQKKWNIDSTNFAEMFQQAMADTENLINNAAVQPLSGIQVLLGKPEEVEFVRQSFRDLFANDHGDLQLRQQKIGYFIDAINERIDKYIHGSWKSMQDMHSVIALLALRYPAENYFYKSTEAHAWADYIEYGEDFGQGESFSLAKYYHMCDATRQALQNETHFVERHNALLAHKKISQIDNDHVLVYDLIYCTHSYRLYPEGDALQRVSTKERIRRAQRREEVSVWKQKKASLEQTLMALETQYSVPPVENGTSVQHRYYGNGIVVNLDGNVLQVKFSNGIKRFTYPEAFQGGFLVANNETAMRKHAENARLAEEIKRIRSQINTLETDIAKTEAKIL